MALATLLACATDNDTPAGACGTHEISCGGACVAIDDLHCGDCQPCANGLDCLPKDGAPNGYACDCTPETIRCADPNGADTCLDPRSPDHCGQCGNLCDQGDQCTEDWSQPLDAKTGNPPLACQCRAPYTKCGGQCVDVLEDDTANCGACGKHCNATEECLNGTCLSAQ